MATQTDASITTIAEATKAYAEAAAKLKQALDSLEHAKRDVTYKVKVASEAEIAERTVWARLLELRQESIGEPT